MPVKNDDSHFRHLKPAEKDYKRSDSGGLFMLVTETGSKLWRYAYRFNAPLPKMKRDTVPCKRLEYLAPNRPTLRSPRSATLR